MKVYKNFDLTNYNAYRLHARCENAYFPDDEEDLLNIYAENPKRKKFLIGNGNNIILSNPFYTEDFIIFNDCFNKIDVNGNEIIAGAGATMLQVSEVALLHGLSGVEIFYDIPSSVGGAIVMNAGASGEEIKHMVVAVRYLDLTDMQTKEIESREVEFEYRNSFFQRNTDTIVLQAHFILTQGNSLQIKEKMDAVKKSRWAKQPRDYPNCGSVFKRPKGFYVGTLIEELGLKGYQIGGAKIAEKHAGFIVNCGHATGQDILWLIKAIKEKVYQQYKIELEVEQRII